MTINKAPSMINTSMLEKTFVHIPGIGLRTEREIWRSGIRSWSDVVGTLTSPTTTRRALRRKLESYVPDSLDALHRKDPAFFRRLTKVGESWRLFPSFEDDCVFLDIETTGLSPVFDCVTLVGLFDGSRYDVYIDGRNLDSLPERLSKVRVLVTFNGSGFDLRFLKLRFPELSLPPIHIDLRWITRRLGYRGGLKEIEKQFGIKRAEAVRDINGFDATVLWSKYLRGDRSALEQLIGYNTEDVVHLKALMEMSYDRLAARLRSELGIVERVFRSVSAYPPLPKLKSGPKMHGSTVVAGLLRKCTDKPLRIVGIDLTGSEKRATGWALLSGGEATTRSIITDAELVRETVFADPDVVSIDSPLSLPEGWINAQFQQRHGAPIYRKCELALKRMGISVFWCLLPSMKSLTTRGMRLAAEFRRLGLSVIESYPGAAQDILGIPRKGASLDELKWGLSRAGISGRYVSERVSHDEVDAITSALVGLFYLADDYLALGTPTEDYLIVPNSPRINRAKLVQIIAETGLDRLPDSQTVKCEFDARFEDIPAFA
jgi:uncharacterized protein YprB with RNaseH-like and TPR domain/predicted nuclease with RNAse H fold